MTSHGDLYDAAVRFVGWLDRKLTVAGSGEAVAALDVDPSGKFWLGRLAPEKAITDASQQERLERLEPCACGLRLKLNAPPPWTFEATVELVAWLFDSESKSWRKAKKVSVRLSLTVTSDQSVSTFGTDVLCRELREATKVDAFGAEVRVEPSLAPGDGWDVDVILVNVSDMSSKDVRDTNLYECRLELHGAPTGFYILESLPDSFRYDRRVAAYGINCSAEVTDSGSISTNDTPTFVKARPRYWNVNTPEPKLHFKVLAEDPIAPSRELLNSLRSWGDVEWSEAALDERMRMHQWTPAMRQEAHNASIEFAAESARIEDGIRLLETDASVRAAFQYTNSAMSLASPYPGWRPFQLGFLLANLPSVRGCGSDSNIVDIVWFATGGGKTETYLGLILIAAFYDRLNGKTTGITAWSRFPLRMLSLQQTQRFANALAAGEVVRRQQGLQGDPFSLGFLVGQGATPNSIKEEPGADNVDYEDDAVVASFRVLLECPFCHSPDVSVVFERKSWRLAHKCSSKSCTWPDSLLPFYIVDDEIYRFLPTVVVGTLDKAASIAMQASMRGLVGGPRGICSERGHGYGYASRSKRPNGCLVPGCRGTLGPLPMEESRYGATFRLQDELHLLKDSLGAVDSHYEALYDDLQRALCGYSAKILASSATLEGYRRQVEVLYRRKARVFPLAGPAAAEGFWSADSPQPMRRYTAVAPRGVTLEYTIDRLLTELQGAMRRFATDTEQVCAEIGIEAKFAPQLLSLYGTDVVYGNTIRDLDAVTRSLETQVQVSGVVNTATLTGRTEFDEVRETLRRIKEPEPNFEDRLHVITASSMMSHGVDLDRLNVMVMLGLPLTTSEFIQATSRVGRTWPGLVLIVPKIGRERDAGIYRSFPQFVAHGDRLIEPIPITRRSRRVLDRTIAGLALARLLMIHEPRSALPLTLVGRVRTYLKDNGVDLTDDAAAVIEMLGLTEARDESIRHDVEEWFEQFVRNIEDPPGDAKFLSDVSPTGSPMLSLRDVEEQVPVHARYTS